MHRFAPPGFFVTLALAGCLATGDAADDGPLSTVSGAVVGDVGYAEVPTAAFRHDAAEFADARPDGASDRPAGTVAEARPSITDRVLAAASERRPDDLLDVAVLLSGDRFDWSRFLNVDDDERALLVAEREAQTGPRQQKVADLVRRLGGEERSRNWLVHSVVAAVPAGRLAELAESPDVRGLSLDSDRSGTDAYSGLETRNGMNVQSLLDDAVDAQQGGGAGGEVRLGIIESQGGSTTPNYPNVGHVGFRDWANGPNRWVSVDDCSGGTCVTRTGTTAGDTHATRVSWIAAGSIDQGQDAGVTRTIERRRRSGVAVEAALYSYRIDGASALAAALQTTIVDGVDIANFSGWVWTEDCEGNYDGDRGGVNAALTNATAAGVLFVKSAGNYDSGETTVGCRIGYPGWRTEAFVVGGVDTSDESTPYGCTGMYGLSKLGGMPHQQNGVNRSAAGIDVLAPAHISYHFAAGTNGYDATYSNANGGTSYSTPIVSGTAALVKEHLMDWLGLGEPGRIASALLAMGDGMDGGGSIGEPRADDFSGFGRLVAHTDGASFEGPWGIGSYAVNLSQGETVTLDVVHNGGPSVPSDLTEFRTAALWYEDDLNDTSDILLEVWDTCAPGGAVRLAQDQSYDLRKGIAIGSWAAGRCLQVRLIGFDLPGGSKTVYTSWQYHTDRVEDTCNGGSNFCSTTFPGEHGEGDCDFDSECIAPAVCMPNVGASYGFASWVDVCEVPDGHWDRCTPERPCAAGEGDCDTNNDCVVGTSCSHNVGLQYGYSSGTDVCANAPGGWL